MTNSSENNLPSQSIGDGSPVSHFPAWPHYEDDEIAAASATLRSGRVNYWTGTEVRNFESEYASAIGARHAIALANGTAALELALAALGVGAGDEVITSPRSFIASASCAVMRGAKPVFADVDRDSQNICAATIEQALSRRTRAIIVVHLAGWPCEMDPIVDFARGRGVAVIEDCAQANGARYRERAVGSIGDLGAFSFCQDKIISTGGEGGLLATQDGSLWSRAWSYKDHGKDYRSVHRRDHPPGFRWVHESFGTNWRMTEFQAAIGRRQLTKLDRWLEQRRRNAQRLYEGLRELAVLRIPMPGPHLRHAFYKFSVFLDPAGLNAGWSRDRVIAEINVRGVPCFSGSCPEIYLEKAFDGSSSRPVDRLPVARELGETSLMFLVHPTLTQEHMDIACGVVRDVVGEASGSVKRRTCI
ncbi:MAG TPA: DegT/DnrJ/EryC1/StrS aminotransferase family protein [Steroidobacteraceae bacterium]|nr:DegT/DnrJ/EryC1/StrS aminotransferase family protein [Steroidobacteraceae bacterium]